MAFIKNIFREIKAQLTDTPVFLLETFWCAPKGSPQLDHLREQLEKALENPQNRLIFITAPHGGGKTTAIRYFLSREKVYPHIYKSFVKIRDLDFAYLHLTSYLGRLFFVFFSLVFTYFLIRVIPQAGAIPFLLALGYFFTKNAASLIYIFYETFHNLFFPRRQIVVLDDLDRSSLSSNDQWALLSNLWQNKRVYIVAMGYPADEQKTKMKIFESVMKLKGVLIEIPPCDHVNIQVAKEGYPDFPFIVPHKPKKEDKLGSQQFPGWLSLFTPEELLLAGKEVELRLSAYCHTEGEGISRPFVYIQILLDWTAKKMGLQHNQVFFDIDKEEIHVISEGALSESQKYYLQTFVESIDPKYKIKLQL